jgi:hypothetical protein
MQCATEVIENPYRKRCWGNKIVDLFCGKAMNGKAITPTTTATIIIELQADATVLGCATYIKETRQSKTCLTSTPEPTL